MDPLWFIVDVCALAGFWVFFIKEIVSSILVCLNPYSSCAMLSNKYIFWEINAV